MEKARSPQNHGVMLGSENVPHHRKNMVSAGLMRVGDEPSRDGGSMGTAKFAAAAGCAAVCARKTAAFLGLYWHAACCFASVLSRGRNKGFSHGTVDERNRQARRSGAVVQRIDDHRR
jgi:hypothetical protein